MSGLNINNNYESADSGKPVSEIIKVKISKEAKSYILDRDGAVTVDIRTGFG